MTQDQSPPAPTSDAVRERMRGQPRQGTLPELLIRRELHRRGLRYRVALKVPGNARRTIDIAFTRQHLAIFVDGCFWHGCPDHANAPKNNADWWQAKLAANAARDKDTTGLLIRVGWTVLRVWEHEDPVEVVDRVVELLGPPT